MCPLSLHFIDFGSSFWIKGPISWNCSLCLSKNVTLTQGKIILCYC